MSGTTVYSHGLCYLSACTDENDAAATRWVNLTHPTGVGPWQIADEPFADGTPNHSPCEHDPDGRRHVLFIC